MQSLIVFIVCCTLVLVSSAFISAQQVDDPLKSLIIQLDDSNFEKTIQLSSSSSSSAQHTDESSWFVLFYSSSCFGCHAIMPSIEMFGSNMRKSGEHKVNVAKVDCNPTQKDIFAASQQTCKRFKVQSFPTMLFIQRGSSTTSSSGSGSSSKPRIYSYFNYRNEKVHTAESILAFVRDPEGAVLGEVSRKIKELEAAGRPVPDFLKNFSFKPWSDEKVPREIITLADEFWHFVDDVNRDFTLRSKGMIHPGFFWAFVLFIGVSLIAVLIAAVFDLTPRRRKISEIMKAKAEASEHKKKNE